MKNILTFALVFISLFASSQTQFLGAPNTTIVVKGNMKVDSILYLPKRSKTPTDTGALRYQISDSSLYVWTGSAWRKAKNDGTVTSVGLTMPTAFAVANSPVTSSGTLAVTATGSATEYIRGDGTLGTLPTSGGGGGSGVNYYLNGSVSQGTIGGSTYYEMSKTPIVGAGTNFTAAADGLMQQFITDAGDPNRLLIPAGAWNFELYFSASSAGGTPTFYVELLKYDGTTFTSISSSSASPQAISNGTTKTLYFTSLAVSETVLTATDRLAIRVYVAVSGRTITFYTEDANLAEIITTFAGGLVSLNGLTANDQFFATGTTGTNFNIASTSATHTFNLPTASATNRGALSSTDWTTFNNKVNISDTASMLTPYIRHGGYGLTKTGQALSVDTSAIATRSRVQKGIDSLGAVKQNVITNPVTGTGTTNRLSKFTASGTIADSRIIDSITKGGIGTQPVPAEDVNFWSVKTSSNSVARGFQSYVNFSGNYGATAIDNYINVNSSTNYDHIAVNQNLFKVEGSAVASTGVHAITASGIYNGTNTTSIGTLLRLGDISGTGTITDKYAIYQTSGLKSHIAGNLFKDGKIAINSSSTSSPSFALTINAAANTLIDYQLNASNFAYTGIASSMFTGGGNGLALSVNSGNKIILGAAGVRFATFESNGNVLIGTSTDGGQKLQVSGSALVSTSAFLATTSGGVGVGTTTAHSKFIVNTNTNENVSLGSLSSIPTGRTMILQTTSAGGAIETYQSTTSSYMNTIFNASGGDLLFGTTNDVGNYKHQVIGNAYINGGVVMAQDSGSVGISTTSPSEKLDVNGRARVRTIDSTGTGTAMNILYADATGVIKKAAVPSGGSGTVTSVATGFGLSGGTITTTGTLIVDSASVATRARVQKGIDSVASIAVKGTGISGYFPKWTGASTQDTSQLFQLGRNIGIGTATPAYRLHLPDAGNTANQAMIAGSVFGSDGNGQTITPGSGAMTYYGQGGVGYLYGAQVSSAGRWGINTRSLNDATFNVDGSVKIVTIDSTSTARNMLYADANGVIKKSVALSMADDVITASGSWVATKDAGSGTTISNVAYTTNGTTKMVTVDGNFYIASASFTDAAWNEIGTITSDYRPKKTVNWNSNFIVSGAEYERSDNTDFTGALSWTYSQMRIKDDGKIEVNASVSSNSVAAGGTAYIIVPFQVSYIVK